MAQLVVGLATSLTTGAGSAAGRMKLRELESALGGVRVFEFRRKKGGQFIRFPLFPGSLLLMEGATQEDWLHCLPRDAMSKEERVNITFRIMYSME